MKSSPWGTPRYASILFALGLAACGTKDSSSGPPPVGPPASLTVVSGSGQDVASGEAAAAPLTVKVVDASAVVVPKALVTFTIASGGGTLSQAIDTTDAAGLASTTWTAGSSLGDARIEARVQGVVAPAAFAVTVKAGPAFAIERTSSAVGIAAAGFVLSDSVAVKVSDRFGHPLSGASVSFTVTTGGGSVTAATRTTGTDGVAKTSWTMGTAGTQTLSANSGQLTVQIIGTAVTCPESQMAIGDVVAINPGAAQCAIMAGTGQRYVVTVTNPTNSPSAASAFRLRGAGAGLTTAATSASVVAPVMAMQSLPGAMSADIRDEVATERAHATALRASMQLMERLGTPTPSGNVRSGRSSSVVMAPVPNVGDIIDMKVPKNFNNLCDASTSSSPDLGAARVRGRVVYVGAHSIMVEDSANVLAGGQLDPVYRSVGQEFDNVMWPILTTNFGNPLAMDAQLQNTGHVFMLFTKVVNALQGGSLAGFVSSGDFYAPAQCASSNQEATFYARVPTSTAAGYDEPGSADNWIRSTRTVIIHETKHVASFAEKIARGGTASGFFAKDQWLEESSAMLSEELWARTIFGYAQRGNVNYASSIYCEVRPRPSANYPQCQPTKPTSLIDHFFNLYDYENAPDSKSIVGPVGSGDFTFYGSGWMFLRWVLDQYTTSESTFLSAMTQQNTVPGVEQIELRTGKTFAQLLSEFSVALTLDDYPGFTPSNSKYTIASWNTRDIFARASADFAPTYFPRPVPMQIRTRNFGNFTLDPMFVTGGGMSVMEISGTQTAKQLFEFKGTSGLEFPADMRISIVRVQ